MESHLAPHNFCPNCGYFSDRASGAMGSKRPPGPGDIAICLSCGAPMIFTETLGLRPMQEEEFKALPAKVKRSLVLAKLHCLARGRIDRDTKQ